MAGVAREPGEDWGKGRERPVPTRWEPFGGPGRPIVVTLSSGGGRSGRVGENVPADGSAVADHPVWTKEFTQVKLRWLSCDLISLAIGIAFIASVFLWPTTPLRVLYILFGLMWILLGAPHTQSRLANRRPNTITIDHDGRSVVRTLLRYENRVTLVLMLLTFAAVCIVAHFWRPFAATAFYTARDRAIEAMALYVFPFLAVFGLVLLLQRPWRRRMFFSPDGLFYRHLGPTVFIPWDTIEDVASHTNHFLQAAVITARPPAQLPRLQRKHLPNGSTEAKLAIYGMTVDPSTIIYAIRRLAADPDARAQLATNSNLAELFAGPTLEHRIAMDVGQTWPRREAEDLTAE